MESEHFDPLGGGFGFIIKVTGHCDHHANFDVDEVVSLDADTREVSEVEGYLDAYIKWDGCSHFNFGQDGYIHLCGGNMFYQHIALMKRLFEKAFEVMGREPDEMSDPQFLDKVKFV